MKKVTLFVMIILVLIGLTLYCGCIGTPTVQNNATTQSMPVDTLQYNKDKLHVADCIYNNVEWYRLSCIKGEEFYDPVNFYAPYSSWYDAKSESFKGYQYSSRKYLTVMVDTILYDEAGCKCFALVVIKDSSRSKSAKYDGRAVIGYREHLTDTLRIYPCVNFGVLGFENYTNTVAVLKDYYFNKLKGSSLSTGVYEGKVFNQNIGDKDFFSNSLFFQRYDKHTYNFQTYYSLWKIYRYDYSYY